MPTQLPHITVKLLPNGAFLAECGPRGCTAVNPQQLRAYVSACLVDGGTVEFHALAWKLFNAGQEGAEQEPLAFPLPVRTPGA